MTSLPTAVVHSTLPARTSTCRRALESGCVQFIHARRAWVQIQPHTDTNTNTPTPSVAQRPGSEWMDRQTMSSWALVQRTYVCMASLALHYTALHRSTLGSVKMCVQRASGRALSERS
jgi:hypothetical protein